VSDLPLDVIVLENGEEAVPRHINEACAQMLRVEVCDLFYSGSLIPGVGMGFSTALVRSVLQFYTSEEVSDEIINSIERLFNPKFSGVDTVGVCNVGLYKFIDGVNIFLGKINFDYFCVNTGCSDTTLSVMQKVSANPEMDKIFKQLSFISEDFESAFKLNDIQLINSSIDSAQQLLMKLGVVDDVAMKAIQLLQQFGHSCKISGAGGFTNGSGMLLCTGKLSNECRNALNLLGCNVVYEFVV
jgi:mevalonate kinase